MSRREGGVVEAVRDLVGALTPLSVRSLDMELRDRLGKIPTELNEYGYDRYGMNPDVARSGIWFPAMLYRYYFRVRAHDIDRVPAGRVLLIANHAGQLPFDAMMVCTAMVLEAEPPRIVRAMGEYWIPRIPWFNVLAVRGGQMVGTPENCVAMLESEECVLAFPEGVRGINKTFDQRYRLQRFGTGFMRLALETGTPIVPVAVVGSEEQNPGLARLPRLARMLGLPDLPITLTFPWLGPLGLLPLPVRYHLYFGEPLRFEGDPNDEDTAIEQKVDVVKRSITDMFARGLRERRGIFV